MNTQNSAKVTKETKKSIRADFDRTPLKDRMKAKLLSMSFVGNIAWLIFRLVLLVGISYVVLFPFISKIAGSFMTPDDMVDVTVRLIAKNPTLDIYKALLFESDYWEAFTNTLLISLISALLQTFVCCLIGYGLAKFRFRGNSVVMLLVILTMVVPHQTLQLSMFMGFRYFDVMGILSFLSGGASVRFLPDSVNIFLSSFGIIDMPDHGLALLNTYWPLVILSATGLAFKNGLYIFMLRQFFTGVPDALEESAYIDGSGVYRTFVTIILPLSIPMMVTVFLFAFCWQWMDDFYTDLFFMGSKITMMPDLISEIPTSLRNLLEETPPAKGLYETAVRNTWGIVIIMPLVILYAFGQKFLVQGIERSGLTAE